MVIQVVWINGKLVDMSIVYHGKCLIVLTIMIIYSYRFQFGCIDEINDLFDDCTMHTFLSKRISLCLYWIWNRPILKSLEIWISIFSVEKLFKLN